MKVVQIVIKLDGLLQPQLCGYKDAIESTEQVADWESLKNRKTSQLIFFIEKPGFIPRISKKGLMFWKTFTVDKIKNISLSAVRFLKAYEFEESLAIKLIETYAEQVVWDG